MKDLLAGIGAWEPRAKIALIVLIIAVASTAGVLTYSIISSDHPEPELVRGDLTVRGSIAQEGVEADEYAGVATLTYELSGSDIEWRILDLDDTVFVRDIGGGYSERGYTTASNGRMLTIDEPGRYSVRLYVDGDLDRSGTAILDGPVDRTFSWMQTLASGASHSYSVSVRYMYSDYLDYHQDDAVHHFQHSFYFAAEIRVSRRVHNVDLGSLVEDGGILGEDGDAPLPLDVVGIHHPFRYFLILPENAALLQQLVHQGGLAVVYMGDDSDISNVFPFLLHNDLPFLFLF